MRPVSIIIAILVAASLYLLVFERASVIALAGGNSAPTGAAGDDAPGADRPVVSVVAIASQAQQIDTGVRLRGQTEAARQVDVRAETSGRIVSAPLRKGSFVEETQTLCQLDQGTRGALLDEEQARLSEAQARAPEAQAQVAASQAQLKESLIEQNAATRLAQGGFASDTRVAQADATVESALAGIAAAKAGVESVAAGVQAAEAGVAAAQKEIDRLQIAAPFAGLLEVDTAELGELLQPGGLCATVIQLDPIKLVGFVPETDVDKIAVGAMAGARLASGRQVQGRVTFLSRAADPETRTFRTEVDVPNDDLAIRDGQTAEIIIQSDGRQAHLVPQSALTLDDTGELGLRVVQDATARFAPVQVLRDTPDGVWVTGLDETATVIVVGQEYVTDGVPVEVTMQEVTP